VAVAAALHTNTSLNTLGMVANAMRDAGAIALANALKTNNTLSTLVLHDHDDSLTDRNLLGDAGTERNCPVEV